MNGNTELLNFVYQNAQMGTATIHQLVGIVHDSAFKEHLTSQLRGYQSLEQKAVEQLERNGCDEKGLSSFEKMRTYLMIDLQTLTDKTPSHIAEMMIIGSNMGVINAIKNLRKYKDAQGDIRSLMAQLQQFEEQNLEQLKKFL